MLHLIDGCVDIFIFNTMLSFQHLYLSARARLSIAFGTLFVFVIGDCHAGHVVQLSLANQRFDGFVHGIQARTLLAATVRTEVLGRGMVRNMALAGTETITKKSTDRSRPCVPKSPRRVAANGASPEVDAATRASWPSILARWKSVTPRWRIVALRGQSKAGHTVKRLLLNQ